ncbi:MAG: DoxX family protein [Desulfobacteraceae bacterium]|nr:DoxX family protein [Desulfobacteraceae bacterium]
MKSIRNILFLSPWVYRAMRWLLGGVFILAAATKLMDPRGFARLISGYNLLPEELLVVVAIGLPIVELLAGFGLVFNVRGSVSVVSGLLAMFLAVLGYAIFENLDVDCGCFSVEEIHAHNRLYMAFYRDLALLSVSFYLCTWRRFHNRFSVQTID